MRTAGFIVIALAAGFAAGFLVKGRLDGEPAKAPDGATGATYSVPPAEQGRTVTGLAGPVYEYGKKVYRGGEPTAIEGAAALHDWGIRTVVSVTPTELERKLCEKYGLQLVEVPFEKTALTGETIDKVIDTLKGSEGPFYIHCHGGKHRGGALAMAYRIGALGWDARRAIEEYEERGGLPGGPDKPMVDAILDHLKARKTQPASENESHDEEENR